MSVRNSSFRNGKDIPEGKLREMQAKSQKDVKVLDHAKDAIYWQRGNWSWKSVSRVSFPRMVTLPVVSFHTHHTLSISIHQTSLYQPAIKLAMPTHCFGRREKEIRVHYNALIY